MFTAARRAFSVSAKAYSAYAHKPRKTLTLLNALYREKTPIAVITAWDHITAQIADAADIDIALVGDSLAMVALGYEDTNELELEELMYHVRAVARGNQGSFIVADVPFGTFELSDSQAIATAIALVKKGRAQGVKIEGGEEVALKIAKIVAAGVPVMGHVGLAPQKHNVTGGYKLQGNTPTSAVQIIKDCVALEKAGVFSIVLECVPNKLAQLISETVRVPTIGIGAGPNVSGQVLVMADMLGMTAKEPAKFVKKYAEFLRDGENAVSLYKKDVLSGAFPDPDTHGYKMKSEVLHSAREFVRSMK